MEDQDAVKATQDSPPADEPDPKRARRETPEPKPTTVLDEYGDLRLCVGADHAEAPSTYLVCSRTLARSSLVMKKMLFGSFAESRPRDGGQDDWVVQLPDDEPAPMQLMLDIIHGHFAKVPDTMDLDTLHALVVLLDKYDAISVTRPWVQAWLHSAKTGKERAASGRDSSKLLSVAWALGDSRLFSKMQSRLIEICEVDEDGRLIVELLASEVGEDKSCWSLLAEETAPLIPPYIIDYMTAARAQWISTKLQPYLTIYHELTQGKWKCRRESAQSGTSSSSTSSPSHCKAIALGSLVRGFLKMGINITDQDPASSYKESLAVLGSRVDALEILVMPNGGNYNHNDCRKMQATQVRTCSWKLVPLETIGDDCRARLETQATKTGLPSK
ncbi:Nuclear pore protein-like protein [Colletotrichum higginsianum IMI 349063]|uniref:Nuclear pore protein-like protein n=2 Tax=Colletotrichum higginsianum TaxID=80884 RepID=A0A1B7YAR7_COLHI|nr:Nuclear pore protein-like protein [Colletotrichum higginsianum IMI 349063]OBR09166.1 Nuclear pore protein-like protein [Colletotrichum higginsianum IMI 349063]TIC95503.1 hypothetical protein CH35J_008217 [Colletotrichum higginsianum]